MFNERSVFLFAFPHPLFRVDAVRYVDIRASVSEDGGRTWPAESEIVIRDDLPNGDLGYPTTIEYEPGKLFCVYYGQDAEGVTFVMGTYIEIG